MTIEIDRELLMTAYGLIRDVYMCKSIIKRLHNIETAKTTLIRLHYVLFRNAEYIRETGDRPNKEATE